jgi:serine/threonine-protein kinase
MRAWDSVTRGGSLRPGPAAFAILLAGVIVSLAPVSRPLETAYYDLLQGLQRRTGSSQIVLIDTGEMARGVGTVWDADTFPALLNALAKAGARLVIPVEPPPSAMTLPDSAQLAALAELEQRSRRETDHQPLPDSDTPSATFSRQLAELRHRAELHGRTAEVAAAIRNLVLAVPTFDGTPGTNAASSKCTKHAFEGQFATDGMDITGVARRVRAAAPPPDSLCRAILGAGHVESWPDEDGVVRRIDLLVNASGTLVPSVALRAVLSLDGTGEKLPTVSRDAIAWDARTIRTTDGSTALIRFYPPRDGKAAFQTIAAADMTHSDAAERVAGRIAILGPAGPDVESGHATPVADRTPPATLLATALSNLLAGDYLSRPAWLSWLERLALVLIGVPVLLWGGNLSSKNAIIAGSVAAMCLLAVQALLVLFASLWAQLVTPAVFAVFSASAIRFLRAGPRPSLSGEPVLTPAPAGASVPTATSMPEEADLDQAFSMLRHQPPNDHVKKRLYDVALEHARHRDLAKAEKVLRYLASVDPDYRNAAEKLKKLAGLRDAAPTPQAAIATPPSLRPVPQPARGPGNLSGHTIGRYKIEQPIGQGAMATVYLGRDPKINRQVAIKTIALAEEFSDTDLVNARTQFLREAESAGRLNHPNIISIYDAGEDGQIAYLAMEYFRGKPLSYYAQQGHLLPPRLVFDLMARAAEALHYAHGQHVVHRDVKPANLLYDADTDALKITDFGIARLTDSSRTKTGIILGTPSYMSPEQLAGKSVTGQSDLFSLGVTLYQLLAGTPPFRADSIPMLMQKIAHETHERVSELRNDLPPSVDGILDRALAKDPADRYASGRAMALALRDCCSSFCAPAKAQA